MIDGIEIVLSRKAKASRCTVRKSMGKFAEVYQLASTGRDEFGPQGVFPALSLVMQPRSGS